MPDPRGVLILGVGLAVPLILLLLRREDWLLGWICLTVSINIFDPRVVLNLPAARVVGLLLLAYAPLGAFQIGTLLRTRPFQILALSFGYLAVLGIIFGFLYPWTHEGFVRPFVQTAPGRTIVYSVRLLADLGVALFVARRIMQGTDPAHVFRLLLWGMAIAAIGGVVELVTHAQLYHAITGNEITYVPGRVRGLNFEPRGLGLMMVYATFFGLLWYAYRRSARVLGLVVLYVFALAIAVSVSALFALAAAWLCLVLVERRVRGVALWGAGTLVGLTVVAVLAAGALAESWVFNIASRLSVEQVVGTASAIGPETLLLFLDIFDYTAVMVMLNDVRTLLLGAGPGLIVLPASLYIPDIARWSWVGAEGQGITNVPSMGLLLEWSNGGILGVALWVAFAVSCWRAFTRAAALEPERASAWLMTRAGFVVVAGSYLVQASTLSAIWAVFMGLGIGAAARALAAPSPAAGPVLAAQPA